MQIQKPKQGYKLVKSLYGKYEEIPEEWNHSKMKDVCKKISVGIATSTTKYFVDKGVPLLRNQNIKEGYIETDDLLHISEEFAKMNQSKKLQEGDVVCMRTGYPGQSAVVPAEMNGWQTFTTLIVRPNHEILDSHYLSIFLNSYGKKQITSIQAGAAQQNLNVGWLSNILISLPLLNEQQKIATILSNVNNLIDSYGKAIESTSRLKTGLMQQLFTRGIRHTKFQKADFGGQIIKEIPEEWNTTTLDEISQNGTQNGLAISISDYGNGIPIVGMTKFYASEVLSFDNMKEVKIHENNKKKFSLKSFDLLFGRRSMDGKPTGGAGKCIIVPEIKIPIVFESSIIRMSVKDLVNPFFIYQLFQSQFGKKLMIRIIRVSAVSGISSGDLRKIKIPLPSKNEQDRIVKILEKFDLKNNDLKIKKINLEQLKIGLMQKLLTGQIRVKV